MVKTAMISLIEPFLKAVQDRNIVVLKTMLEPSVVVQFPFAPVTQVKAIQGTTQVVNYYQNHPTEYHFEFATLTIFETTDVNKVWAQWKGTEFNISLDRHFHYDYVAYFEGYDGQLSRYCEYTDSITRIEASLGFKAI